MPNRRRSEVYGLAAAAWASGLIRRSQLSASLLERELDPEHCKFEDAEWKQPKAFHKYLKSQRVPFYMPGADGIVARAEARFPGSAAVFTSLLWAALQGEVSSLSAFSYFEARGNLVGCYLWEWSKRGYGQSQLVFDDSLDALAVLCLRGSAVGYQPRYATWEARERVDHWLSRNLSAAIDATLHMRLLGCMAEARFINSSSPAKSCEWTPDMAPDEVVKNEASVRAWRSRFGCWGVAE
jgi:hypothetical protein